MVSDYILKGMPTGPDVKKIRDNFPDDSLVEGETVIDHKIIADLIQESVD